MEYAKAMGRQLSFLWSQPSAPQPAPEPRVETKHESTERSRAELATRLNELLGHPVEVVITDNRRSVIRMMKRKGVHALRLHHMFLRAPESILADLAAFLHRPNRKANARLDHFIDAHHDQIRKGVSRNTTLRPLGKVHDLQLMLESLNAAYFDGAVDARITWGRAPNKKRRRSIRLGTYASDERLIRIHPSLDADWVPRYVVELVVYHEMLHAVVPPVVRGSHKVFHTPEFRKRERAHPDFERANAWEQKNLLRLLRS